MLAAGKGTQSSGATCPLTREQENVTAVLIRCFMKCLLHACETPKCKRPLAIQKHTPGPPIVLFSVKLAFVV